MADLRIADAPEIPTEDITGEEKLPTGGNGNYSISLDSLADYTKTKKDLADNTTVDGKVSGVRQELDAHIEDLLNPHQVTKGQIGLGNVDNTADVDKPVSNSTQASIISAVAPKADKTYVDNQLTLKANKVDVYTKLETYTKQESNDLVNSSISTALTPVNNSLDLAKRGVANRYDSSLTYSSGERVVLNNGDIVKSTIDGNTVNPNVDMTGWVKTNLASQIFDESGLSQQEVNSSEFIKSPQLFGAEGGAANDQTVFTDLSTEYAYALGKEYTVPVWRPNATKFTGNGTVVHVDSFSGDTTVCLQIKPNSNYSDIDFINNQTQKKPWTYSTIGNNSVLTNVGFYNFDDPNEIKNSWGIYLENKENITLINPKFGGNGVSDIAIVDNVKNITIVNAKNTVSSDGVHLDIEPNGSGNIENINIFGGEYSTINVLENDYLSFGIKNINIIGANIKLLELRGGQTKIIGGKVSKIKGNWANSLDYEGMQNEYFCSLAVDNVNLSENLISDEYLNSLSTYDTNSFWSIYAPDGVSIQREFDRNETYISINKNKSGVHVLPQRNYQTIPSGASVICIAMSYSVDNSDLTMYQPCYVDFYNDSNTQVGASYSIKGGRTENGTDYDWSNEVAIFDIPEGATKFKVFVRSNVASSTLMVRKIGVHTLSITDGTGNFNSVISGYAEPVKIGVYKQSIKPVDLNYGYNGLIVETLSGFYEYVGSVNTFTLKTISKKSVFATVPSGFTVNAGATYDASYTIEGAIVGQVVKVALTQTMGSSIQIWGEVTAKNTVHVYIKNTGSSSFVLSGNFNIVLD